MNNKTLALIVALIIVLLGIFMLTRPAAAPDMVACTMDAKICPDGSSVGRVAPNCEFAQCPGPTPVPPPIVVPGPRACTMEAKICPDGTAVGRTGPNCEFAPCPGQAPAY